LIVQLGVDEEKIFRGWANQRKTELKRVHSKRERGIPARVREQNWGGVRTSNGKKKVKLGRATLRKRHSYQRRKATLKRGGQEKKKKVCESATKKAITGEEKRRTTKVREGFSALEPQSRGRGKKRKQR